MVVILLLLALIAGAIIWLLESKKNREMFGGKYAEGFEHGIWWAMVTMTTVGYSDKEEIMTRKTTSIRSRVTKW